MYYQLNKNKTIESQYSRKLFIQIIIYICFKSFESQKQNKSFWFRDFQISNIPPPIFSSTLHILPLPPPYNDRDTNSYRIDKKSGCFLRRETQKLRVYDFYKLHLITSGWIVCPVIEFAASRLSKLVHSSVGKGRYGAEPLGRYNLQLPV